MHRRRHGRVQTPGLTARLYQHGRLAARVAVENLSLGGALIRSPLPLSPRCVVGLALPFTGQIGFRLVTARVVNAFRAELDPFGRLLTRHGLAFQDLARRDETALRNLVLVYAAAPMALAGDSRRPSAAAKLQGAADPAPAGVETLMKHVKGLLAQLTDSLSESGAFQAPTPEILEAAAKLREAAGRFSPPVLRPVHGLTEPPAAPGAPPSST